MSDDENDILEWLQKTITKPVVKLVNQIFFEPGPNGESFADVIKRKLIEFTSKTFGLIFLGIILTIVFLNVDMSDKNQIAEHLSYSIFALAILCFAGAVYRTFRQL